MNNHSRQEEYSELIYKQFKPFKAIGLLLKSFAQAKNQEQKQAILNRLKDYFKIRKQLPLHYKIAKILEAQARDYPSYDYGQGYFYQSCEPVNITGFRNTEVRIQDMHLQKYLSGKTVLDIGTNAGFLALEIAPFCKRVDAFDINPYLIEIGNCVKAFLQYDNVKLWAGTFEEFTQSEKYDVVLSFANHTTYDQNTKQSVDEYFKKCSQYLEQDALMLFESHYPGYETPAQLESVLTVLKNYFTIQESYVLKRGACGDKGRTFAVCKKK